MMAKSERESSLLGEMASVSLYKRNQGRLTRQLSGVGFGLILFYGCWVLSQNLEGEPAIRIGIPVLIAAIGVWFIFRLLNYSRFADFLISVEAEMDKVTWSSKEELYRATVVVIVNMLLLAVFLLLCDIFWQWFFRLIGFLQIDTP